MKKYRNIFIASMMASLLLSMLPIVIFYDSAALSYYSWLPIAFFLGSIVWAIIAYRLRDRGNLFFHCKGRLSTALMYTFTGEKSYAERAKYKSDIKICSPPTHPLHPVNPDNARHLRITAAAGT